jgi:negative regulator of sigma-B (phosphoserine phosphatase)
VTGDLNFLNWAVAGAALPGETSSGDLGVVAPNRDGVLIAVIDGLGHGEEAAEAAAKAAVVVREWADKPIDVVLSQCHDALRRTRGAVMTLIKVNAVEETMSWTGVGNIEGRLWHADPAASLLRQAPPLRGGVVGHALPRISTTTLPLTRGDLMILSTDGLSSRFHEEFRLEGTVQQIADNILGDHWMAKDDALVLVARYLGQS